MGFAARATWTGEAWRVVGWDVRGFASILSVTVM